MAKKKRQAVDNAYNAIIGGDVRAGKGKEPNPLGVKLTAEEIARLDEIAKELGVVRHHVLQFAIRDLIARWERGERPRVVKKTINILES